MKRPERLRRWLLLMLLLMAPSVFPSSLAAGETEVNKAIAGLSLNYGKGREQAARDLAEMGAAAARAVPALRKALSDNYEPARVWAAIALANIDPEIPECAPVLFKVLAGRKEELRLPALHGLLLLDPTTPGLGEAFAGLLEDPVLQKPALSGLVSMGAAGAELLVGYFDLNSTRFSGGLPEFVTDLGGNGITMFTGLLHARPAAVRESAARLLSVELRDTYPAPVPYLLTVLGDEGSLPQSKGEYSGDAIRMAVARWKTAKAVEERNGTVEGAAVMAVESGAAAAPGLAGLLAGHPNDRIRARAAVVLGLMGPAALEVVSAVRKGANEFSLSVRTECRWALGNIVPEDSGAGIPDPVVHMEGLLGARSEHLRSGGTEPYQKSVRAALEWLARHQEDGIWRADEFGVMCGGKPCTGPGNAENNVALTGLALLAFMAEGETWYTKRYGRNVRDGIEWLLSMQDQEGCFGPRKGANWAYGHAIATLAMIEASAMSEDLTLRQRAQAGVDYVQKIRRRYGAWSPGLAKTSRNDVSISSWMVLVLRVAEQVGLRVEPASFLEAISFLDKVTEPLYGRVGCRARGDAVHRPEGMLESFPPERSESTTAMGITMRIICGADRDDEYVKKGALICFRTSPIYDGAAGAIDFYYWHWGSLGLIRVGDDPSKRWLDDARRALVMSQWEDSTDHRSGSWDPDDPWSGEGGRVYSTAINCLTLQTPWRYTKALGENR